ncbi:MAG: DUF5615 family PIN-like protein [Prolixibacteraceae bacterium]
MKFLANENFPAPGIFLLRNKNIDVISIAENFQGATDEKVIKLAIEEKRIILTHDSDYGELIFNHGFRPQEGVVYFRLLNFEPVTPAKILLELISKKIIFKNQLTVIDEKSVRQRSFRESKK